MPVKDITGEKFGRLTVLYRVENDKGGKSRWRCACDCGSRVDVTGSTLRSGHTKSCGCLNRDIISKACLNDLTGRRFGNLTVINRAEDYVSPSGAKHVRWRCQCDCGNYSEIDACQLTQGKTKSCGCLHKAKLSQGNPIHNGSHDRLYKVYYNMKKRCYNSKSPDFAYYGGRGIGICDEWNSNYSAFRDWAMENGYNPNAKKWECTIDRIDVDGDYSPENCRWVSMDIQSKNRRNIKNTNNKR